MGEGRLQSLKSRRLGGGGLMAGWLRKFSPEKNKQKI